MGSLVFDAYPDMAPGPFARTPTNKQAIAGLLAQAISNPNTYDHLGFLVGSASASIFANPKLYVLDEFPDSSDVLDT
jgi:hypothetical protein